MDDDDAPVVRVVGDGQILEIRAGLADTGDADEEVVAPRRQAPHEAVQGGHDVDGPAGGIDPDQLAGGREQQPQLPVDQAGGVGHREVLQDHRVVCDVHQDAAVEFPCPPALGGVGVAEGGDVAGAAVLHGDAVEVAAVAGGDGGQEGGLPGGAEVVPAADAAQAGELGVDRQQAVGAAADVVDVEDAGVVAGDGDPQAVEVAGFLRVVGGHVPGVAEDGDLADGGQGHQVAVDGDPHGMVEGAGVLHEAALAQRRNEDQSVGLVRADRQGDAVIGQQCGHGGVEVTVERHVGAHGCGSRGFSGRLPAAALPRRRPGDAREAVPNDINRIGARLCQ